MEHAANVPGSSASHGGGDNGVPMMLTNQKVFACWECRKTLTIPVYQCMEGHVVVCSHCYNKRKPKCPNCSMIAKERCRAIEKVMESVKTVCCYAPHGCHAVIRYSEKREHEKICTFVPCICPIPLCNWVSNSSLLGKHFRMKHFQTRTPFKYGELCEASLKRDMTNHYLQSIFDGKLFVLSNAMMERQNSLILIHVGPTSLLPQFYYEVRAMSDGAILMPQTPVETTEGLHFEFSLASFFQIPLEMWSSNGQINLQFRITTMTDADKAAIEEKSKLKGKMPTLDDFYP